MNPMGPKTETDYDNSGVAPSRLAQKLRYFLLVFLPTSLIIGLGAWSLRQAEDDLAMVRLQSTQELAVGLGANALARHLDSVNRDLRYIANQEALRLLLNAQSPDALEYLTRDLIAFSDAARFYDQIRWIDETGLERVRVDRVGGAAVAVPAERLQNKATRYFFTDTMALNPGQVFVSPLDLNIEGDAIEVPYKPMLRFATPVSDASGRKRGIVILNYLGRAMIEEFASATGSLSDDISLVNGEGYWLKAADSADEWGFMFDRPLTFGSRYPEVWARMRTTDSGQLRTSTGLWTWRTLHPLALGEVSSTGAAAAAGPSQGRVDRDGYAWKAISRVHPAQLAALGAATATRYGMIAGSLMGLLAVVSWLLASTLDDRARARELLQCLATTDGLTGVANRRYFMEQMQQYWSGFQRHPRLPVGIVMMDLDHFKAINDSHGHSAGDMVLQHFGRILRASLRDTDTAGRIGGEEFCVLLRGSDLEGVRAYAERVRHRLETEPVSLGTTQLAMTVSCGGTIFLGSDTIPAAAMQRADAALYRAKAGGRNRVELG